MSASYLGAEHSYAEITERVMAPVLGRGRRIRWWLGLLVAFVLVMLLLFSITMLLAFGVGLWGIMIPVAWGYAITTFVWWIGIGHAGTLISAVLFLLRQQWRTSINRFAEAMTIFAVANAALYPLLHLGRPWFFYWLVPYPATTSLWPQFRSPLIWDFFAVGTYFTISLIFWYLGMLPDLASVRDRARSRAVKVMYGLLALGWRGSARHWQRYEQAYFLLAALATPLVVSVHSVVSADFAVAIVPGWHSTIFPPYFVAGAIYSGFAMVLTIAIPLRAAFHFEDFITQRHLDVMARIMLVTGLIVAYAYVIENFMAWYSGNSFELAQLLDRTLGPYAPLYWLVLALNVGAAQALWLRRVRTNVVALFVIALAINVGMWLERFVIVVGALSADFLPAVSRVFHPTVWDWAILAGTLGLFTALLFLFVRLLPALSAFELRRLLHESSAHG